MSKQPRAFKSEKRRKELLRFLKKQEEKRLRRFKKDITNEQDAETESSEDIALKQL